MPQMMPLLWIMMLMFLMIMLFLFTSFLYFFLFFLLSYSKPTINNFLPHHLNKKIYWNWAW